jgi:hypothetical protein
LDAWASSDFFPDKGKNFPRGWGKNPFLPKKNSKKILFFTKKSDTFLEINTIS